MSIDYLKFHHHRPSVVTEAVAAAVVAAVAVAMVAIRRAPVPARCTTSWRRIGARTSRSVSNFSSVSCPLRPTTRRLPTCPFWAQLSAISMLVHFISRHRQPITALLGKDLFRVPFILLENLMNLAVQESTKCFSLPYIA